MSYPKNRSSRAEVRNPVLGMPAMARIQRLPPEAREALQEVLRDMAVDAAARAQRSWLSNKGPMAAYWKAVSVYAKHVRAAVRRPPPIEPPAPDPNQPALF